jgi:hypothetical protein
MLAEGIINVLRLSLGFQDDLCLRPAPTRAHPAYAAQQNEALRNGNLRRQVRRELPQEQTRLIGFRLRVVVVVQETLGQVFEAG